MDRLETNVALPLTGIKILDLSPDPDGSPCALALGPWGADCVRIPPGLNTGHPEGKRILLMLIQEADIVIAPVDLGIDIETMLEYNPRLIVCSVSEASPGWQTVAGILVAIIGRSQTGLGQHLTVSSDFPSLAGLTPSATCLPDPMRILDRLGYDAVSIAALRQEGVL